MNALTFPAHPAVGASSEPSNVSWRLQLAITIGAVFVVVKLMSLAATKKTKKRGY